MSKPEELFPFPPFPAEKPAGGAAVKSETTLTAEEVGEVRTLLGLLRSGKLSPAVPVSKEDADPFAAPPPLPAPSQKSPASDALQLKDPNVLIPESVSAGELRDLLLRFAETRQTSAAWEIEVRASLKSILTNIKDQYQFVQIFVAMAEVFPIREHLRHGTPEQKLFALNVLGDRFFQTLSGVFFPQRKELVKTIARYLSETSELFTFIAMEGEPFNNQFHERVDIAMVGGRLIKEMRGFVVCRKNSEQIVRIGRVLT